MEKGRVTEVDRDALYRRLVELPGGCRPALDASLPEVTILNDTTLQIENRRIGLRSGKGVRLYIVNSLLMNTEVCTPSQLRDAYGFNGTTAAFSAAMQKLLQEIGEATDAPLLHIEDVRVPPSRRPRPGYVLQAPVVDRRVGRSAEGWLALNVAVTDNGEVGLDERGHVLFGSSGGREQVVSRMLGAFASHRQVEQGLTAMLRGHIGRRSYQNRILPVGRYSMLDEEVELELFHAVEEGIYDFVQTGGEEKPKVILAVLSALRLYLQHGHLIGGYATSMSRGNPADYPELYQQGAMGLLTAVGQTSLARREAYGPFTYTAGWYIRNAMVRWFYDTKGLFPLHSSQKQALDSMKDASNVLVERGVNVSRQALAEETGFSLARVSALFARTAEGVYLEDKRPGYETATYGDVLSELTFEEKFDRVMLQEDVDVLFASPELTDREKIVLSLQYGVYSRRLAGAEMRARGKGLVFTYPYTEEDFDDVCRATDGLHSLDMLFGLQPGTTSAIHRKALKRARLALADSNYAT